MNYLTAGGLLLLVTPHALKSDWVMCEAGAAWAMNIPIIAAHMYGQISDLPEPIRQRQHRPIVTNKARIALADEIRQMCKEK